MTTATIHPSLGCSTARPALPGGSDRRVDGRESRPDGVPGTGVSVAARAPNPPGRGLNPLFNEMPCPRRHPGEWISVLLPDSP